jgi:hypothetical protein
MTAYALTNELPIPNDFPRDNYETIGSLVFSKCNNTNKDEYFFFLASWKGFLHRFLACTDHDKKYIESITLLEEKLLIEQKIYPYERYLVERELFNFLINGLAAIECLCSALFAMAAIEEIAHTGQTTNLTFSIKTEKELRRIFPSTTTEKFHLKFENETITRTLKDLFNTDSTTEDTSSITEDAKQYKEWKKIRDILAHRGQPGRKVALSSGSPEKIPDLLNLDSVTKEDEKDLPIIKFTPTTTASMREWLTKIINNILLAGYTFVNNSNIRSEL